MTNALLLILHKSFFHEKVKLIEKVKDSYINILFHEDTYDSFRPALAISLTFLPSFCKIDKK